MSSRAHALLVSLCVLACASCTSGRAPGADACPRAIELGALPATVDGTTLGAACATFDRYSCDASADLSGAEVVYRVTLPTEGFLVVAKGAESAPGTVVRILGSADPMHCRDGHASSAAARMPAGDAYIAVDGAAGAEGPFSLRVALTTEDTFVRAGITPALAADALTVVENAWAWGASRRTEYVVVDFSLHSSERREWIFDLATGELLDQVRVAHGRASTNGIDLAHAVQFSNVPGSNQSSLGLLRSAGTYIGVFGPSFRLEGLEPGINDHVCSRDIVMHPWAPVGDEYVTRCGWARPSLGCPAIDSTLAMPIRDRLARPDGTTLHQGAEHRDGGRVRLEHRRNSHASRLGRLCV